MVKHCYECHSANSKDLGGQLRLDSHEGIARGGHSGPAIVAGKPAESLLVTALRYDELQMPPDDPLPPQVVEDFVQWVRDGDIDPRTEDAEPPSANLEAEGRWAFAQVQSPPLPPVKDVQWARDPVDYFVLSRLEDASRRPAQDTDARTLILRLAMDLLGLKPTFDEIQEL